MTDRNPPLPSDIERDPVHQTAAEWLVRLQNTQVSVDDVLAWQSWIHESPRHAEAFARLEETSQALRSLASLAGAPGCDVSNDGYDGSVPLKDYLALDPPPGVVKEAPRSSRLSWFALAATLAAVAIASVLWSTSSARLYYTAVGENRSVTLADGSTIALGGDTRLEVSLSRKVRAIELARGEALFKVAKDPDRPFEVRAGAATVIAVGTEFNVQRDSDRAIVSVTEGRVLVEPVSHFLPLSVLQQFEPKLRPVRLSAGQQTMAGISGIEEPTTVEDPTAATAWQMGRLAFHLQPLRYVLEHVNRYAPKRIVLGEDSLGSLVITGTVQRENIDGWIGSLERAFALQASEESDRIVIRSR
jgi:transmembrane sensor